MSTHETTPTGCKIERSLNCLTDRYEFDFKLCTPAKGWAQVDTSQDAHYLGAWANPTTLQIISYCEGDINTVTAENEAQFVAELRSAKTWNLEAGYTYNIDPMNDDIEAKFRAMGAGDLLHPEYAIDNSPVVVAQSSAHLRALLEG